MQHRTTEVTTNNQVDNVATKQKWKLSLKNVKVTRETYVDGVYHLHLCTLKPKPHKAEEVSASDLMEI